MPIIIFVSALGAEREVVIKMMINLLLTGTLIMLISTSSVFSQGLDWSNFNSSLVIEVTRPEGVFTCSGVAVKKDTVITAAHCLAGEILKIRVFNNALYKPKEKSWGVTRFELHPEYNQKYSNYHSDLARLKLLTPLPDSTMIYPIIKNSSDLKGNIIRLGYGARDKKNARTLITPIFKNYNALEKTLELDDQNSFSGDSGGPIFIQNGAQMYLMAIHSTLSFGPNGKFSYNPLLSEYRDWILSTW
jgi:V8-like Glu-specific endopeptidase